MWSFKDWGSIFWNPYPMEYSILGMGRPLFCGNVHQEEKGDTLALREVISSLAIAFRYLMLSIFGRTCSAFPKKLQKCVVHDLRTYLPHHEPHIFS